MKVAFLSLTLLMAGSLFAPAQDTVGKDLKDAGANTKAAAKTGTSDAKSGVKRGATATKRAARKGTHKAASETNKGATKLKQKTSDTGTH